MNLIFRKAKEGDIPKIVKMLADDELGSKREDYKVPLPKSYYDAFQNILQDKNQELIILENYNKIKRINPKKNVVVGFGITKKTISSLKECDGLVVGSAICKAISASLKSRQNPVIKLNKMVKALKNKII